ncbi:nucleoside recognition domain-containing protein [Metabacillus idriensis]|uniref:nucleoside recognition domain-containing protein n=1 Tax=Metabacillus idriensis TaxID=324768 RepID=UPI003D29426E
MLAKAEITHRIAIIGMESSGKTTFFSKLTNQALGEESNVKGSTYSVRTHRVKHIEYVDTPGIHASETFSNEMVKKEVNKATGVALIVRGTHLEEEIAQLAPYFKELKSPVLIVATYADKMTGRSKNLLKKQILSLKLPLILLDSRKVSQDQMENFHACIEEGQSITEQKINQLLDLPLDQVDPDPLWLDDPFWGKWVSVLLLISMFLLPVMAAYWIGDALSPLADQYVITPMQKEFSSFPSLLENVLIGNYGLLSLGIYSFIWAFPVVFLIGCSTAIADETGIKDRIVDSLDSPLRKIGLNGKDLIPVLSGFGCNVVAVFQSRGCSLCTRKSCVSLISFGSACSYQIGATLSVFNSAQKPWLFLPYLLLLIIGGILHMRLWNHQSVNLVTPVLRKAFLQKPTKNGFLYRLKSDLKKFCTQALPIFFIICIVASLLYEAKLLQYLSVIFHPVLKLMGLPAEAAYGLVFSIIRKDGILVFNEGNGALLAQINDFQLIILVFMASTLTACVVTMMTVWKELGRVNALQLIGKQMATSILCTGILFSTSIFF